ncbi:dehydrogenase [Haliangium sp.]|uniref:zinc-dependent alcohol dehydrogenase n=1 Tax=Haliangium sp. TaxID=2663208 RepID=UPI003D149700
MSSPPDTATATARAFWLERPGHGAIRTQPVPAPKPDEVLVRTLASGVSRGTESLVFRGEVPTSEYERMRAPFQEGDFPGPVKYGYASVGRVEAGPPDLLGQRVFCLYPHQDLYVVGADWVTPVPDQVPDQRAVLAANMETAVNALWDAGVRVGDRVAVVGGGVVGLLCAHLAAHVPGVALEVVDVDPGRAEVCEALGLTLVEPAAATAEADVVLHCSGHPAGLRTALDLAGFEATVVELSWFGSREVKLPLGGAFHAKRLRLQSSQVGSVAPSRRARRSHAQRLGLALSLLTEAGLDALIGSRCSLAELPARMPTLTASQSGVLCHVVLYP